ncbi:hypothetical protein [Saccharopolyspora erythraea]|uniref:hypothetical protein n=1 Tax=Saccharopolyspora erythraea TaxID=1836 RepID=UPI00117BAC24|nr:hypothetical protein JQX30_10740 [Saccharopolyspora erythraea]
MVSVLNPANPRSPAKAKRRGADGPAAAPGRSPAGGDAHGPILSGDGLPPSPNTARVAKAWRDAPKKQRTPPARALAAGVEAVDARGKRIKGRTTVRVKGPAGSAVNGGTRRRATATATGTGTARPTLRRGR